MTVEELVEEIERGVGPKYLFFWGHQPEKDGSLGKGCLSQWWEASFEVAGVEYPSAEHYMMAEKARLFGDEEALQRILRSGHPGEAKKLGRGVRGFEAGVWSQRGYEIVVAGNVPGSGCWWRPARETASGVSVCRRRTRTAVTRAPSEVGICSALP